MSAVSNALPAASASTTRLIEPAEGRCCVCCCRENSGAVGSNNVRGANCGAGLLVGDCDQHCGPGGRGCAVTVSGPAVEPGLGSLGADGEGPPAM